MKRYLIKFSYDGTNYHGLQKQLNSDTIQDRLEIKISEYLGIKSNITPAGRTDSGVHAKQMFAHIDIEVDFDEVKFCKSLNMMLPKDICIESLYLVNDDFHARFDALSRTYKYYIKNKKDPFNYRFSYYLKDELNIASMNNCCDNLLNSFDFKCFSKSNTDVKTYECNVLEAKWYKDEDDLLFEITANRFLRNMVRSIVGTMIEVGRKKISQNDFQKILESRDRKKAGFSVPASGLFITKINYKDIFKKKWKI
tara:strand:- start:6026 stop:6784 length:759 start_codon:yes stop_codon:yes gene_type:complete